MDGKSREHQLGFLYPPVADRFQKWQQQREHRQQRKQYALCTPDHAGPTALAGDSLKVNNNPAVLNMNVSYLSQDVRPSASINSRREPTSWPKVTITNPGKRSLLFEIALTQIFPSGWRCSMPVCSMARVHSNHPTHRTRIPRTTRCIPISTSRQNRNTHLYIQLNASLSWKVFPPSTFCKSDVRQQHQRRCERGNGWKS